MTQPTTTNTSNVGRDRRGRFTESRHLDGLRFFVNASNGETHSHTGCGNLRADVATGVTFTRGNTVATGWLCSACVHFDVSTRLASMDLAPVTGTQTCDTCDNELGMRSFPTVSVVPGVRDRGTTCRSCEKAARTATRGARNAAKVAKAVAAHAAHVNATVAAMRDAMGMAA